MSTKVIIERGKLTGAMKLARTAVSKEEPNITIEPRSNDMIAILAQGRFELVIRVEAESSGEFEPFLLSAYALGSFISVATGEYVTLSIAEKKITIMCGNSRGVWNRNVLGTAVYFAPPNEQPLVILESGRASHLTQVVRATLGADGPMGKAIGIRRKGNEIQFVATDGYAAAAFGWDVSEGPDTEPVYAYSLLVDFVERYMGDSDIYVYGNERRVWFISDTIEASARRVGANLPFDQIIEKARERATCTINVDPLLIGPVLTSMDYLRDDKSLARIGFAAGDNVLVITAKNEQGEAHHKIEAEVQGEYFGMEVDALLLSRAIKCIDAASSISRVTIAKMSTQYDTLLVAAQHGKTFFMFTGMK